MDQEIINYVKNTHNVLIGERTAEQIKVEIGTALKGAREKKLTINGRNLITGLPSTITISSDEAELALRDICQTIVKQAKLVLEETLPELSSDIKKEGIYLTGGGALLYGLDKLLEKELKIPVIIAEDPLNCVAEGCGIMLESPNYFK